VLGGSLGGYAIHEHHTAQNLTVKNQQSTAELTETKHELSDLTSKVNVLVARADAQQQAAQAATAGRAPRVVKSGQAAAGHVRREDPRYKKLQAQVDAQGKAIEDTRNDLTTARTELTGSIAHTHDELVLLEKKGERNYVEFDIVKSKEFQHKGPFGIRLKKSNVKHQYADLELIVDDRNLSQKHINLYQPVTFYTPDSPQAVEVVINSISKDHIHGYVSAPKYRQSELASMASANDATKGTDGGVVNTQAAAAPERKRLTVPQ
jgi:hypothetical protein